MPTHKLSYVRLALLPLLLSLLGGVVLTGCGKRSGGAPSVQPRQTGSPGDTASAPSSVQAMVYGTHLLVVEDGLVSVYRLDRLPSLELVNAVELPSSLEAAKQTMGGSQPSAQPAVSQAQPSEQHPAGGAQTTATSGKGAVPSAADVAAGRKVYASQQCADCHRINGSGGTVGPDLTHEGSARDAAWIEKKITDPKATDSASMMPAYELSQDDLNALVGYMASLK